MYDYLLLALPLVESQETTLMSAASFSLIQFLGDVKSAAADVTSTSRLV